ncbi:hypothetical protein [Methylobacter sp. BlB1]|uniref:hypothetical protein n=1 Tax=Methylobacter sp. BlB1 TaxID=2785914 RepID=UPI0018943B00|nr:hypothetical protein [Methylobacter sp. BlB1]MBF6650740.1 hypothetical protein [Methylobacter sp. BlB1]
MNAIGLTFTLVASLFLFILPRCLAAIPLLMCALYMTRGQELLLGPAHFDVMRILVMVGAMRVLLRGERIANGINHIDGWVIIWAIWLIGTSAFHTSNSWVFRSGMLWTELGCYFLFRVFVQDWEDVRRIFKFICILLVPTAILMLWEKAVGKNYFAVFLGGISEVPALRDGHFRAKGPFDHAILAGTVGAACFPMALYLWKSYRKHALVGLFAAGGILFASTSSGPMMMVVFILFGLVLWRARKYLQIIRWGALVAVISLQAVMNDPVYFLMARIDITGGSNGWTRARLIQSSIEHLDEWWIWGTDYTRHWMATGIYANSQHVDITNHFLAMGVMGGLLLIFLFIMILVAAFRIARKALQMNESAPMEYGFIVWTLGAILFGHVVNFFSITLFDQSIVFFYLILAGMGAIHAAKPFSALESKHSVNHIRQSRYVAVGRHISAVGITRQKTHFLEGNFQKIDIPSGVWRPKHSNTLFSNSYDDHLSDGIAHTKFRIRYRMCNSLVSKSTRTFLKI